MSSPSNDVDPSAAQSLSDFADCLKRVRARADSPSYRELEEWGARHGTPLPRSTVADVLNAQRLPRQKVLLAFLAACGVSPARLPAWQRVWARLVERQSVTGAISPAPHGTGAPAPTRAGQRAANNRARSDPNAAGAPRGARSDPDALQEIAELRAAAEREIAALKAQAAREIHGRRLAAQVASDVREAGLRRIGTNYLNELPWAQMLSTTTELDIFVAYGQTWRNLHARELHNLAGQASSRIRVFLPDPDDQLTVAVLARRFVTTPEDLVRRIGDTRQAYLEMTRPGGARIEVYYTIGDRLFSFYRLDRTAVVGLYSHSRSRAASVPVFVCEAPGGLHRFITDEISSIEANSRSYSQDGT